MSAILKCSVYLIVIAACILGSYGAPSESTNITLKEFCINETKVSREKVDKFEENPDTDSADEDVLCYTHCIMVNMGVINDDGLIVVKEFNKFFDGFDMECVKKVPRIENCTDITALYDCSDE